MLGPDWSGFQSRDLGKAVMFGQSVDRHSTRGSPVVPDSCQLVHEDNESALYAVTILKSQYEVSLLLFIFTLIKVERHHLTCFTLLLF